ncbi:MAG: Lacal_2735 family protein [Cyclobacteriaceae bacterium]
MFNLFKKKSEAERLEEKYKKLIAEAYKLSHTNRTLSDQKQAEAEEIRKQIEKLTV